MNPRVASSLDYIINVDGEQCWAQDGALWHSFGGGKWIRQDAFSLHLLNPVGKIAGETVAAICGQANAGEPLQEDIVIYGVKCLGLV